MGTRKYPPELRERAVRLYRESEPRPVIRRLAEQLNVHPEALRIRQAEADHGERNDLAVDVDAGGEPETGEGERRTAPCQRRIARGECIFRVRDRPDPEAVMRFIDAHDNASSSASSRRHRAGRVARARQS